MYAATNKIPLMQRTRLINSNTLTNFQTLLKEGTWEYVYENQGTDYMFNSFLSTFLHIFAASFPVKYKSTSKKKKKNKKKPMTGSHKV
jgi:hypothetical protein